MNLRPAGAASSPSLVAQACSQVFGFSAAMLNLAPNKPTTELPQDTVPHGFLLLPFRECHLSAMKRHGCAEAQAAAEHGVPFVSTNDMVTSAGWMLMRRLSGREENSMNIVVNIRGRGGTQNFGAGHGLFGNGITAATAVMAPCRDGGGDISIASVAAGARAARRALTACYEGLPDKLASSRRGEPDLGAAVGAAFCTTSWHFPLCEPRPRDALPEFFHSSRDCCGRGAGFRR